MLRPILAALIAILVVSSTVHGTEPGNFPSATIDLGTVVSDLPKSVRFYTEGIGLRELKGFDVSADVAAAAGLTDSKPLSIRVLVLGEGPEATKLKLMQVAGTSPRTGDTDFIHSHTGFRYLTISVSDTTATLERLAKLGVKPLAKSPVALPESLAPGMYLTCVRDPDGNIVELLGPRK
jgi:catechol 2,3-dioxygenase-like lactoylglutathione lyase family enzyme